MCGTDHWGLAFRIETLGRSLGWRDADQLPCCRHARTRFAACPCGDLCPPLSARIWLALVPGHEHTSEALGVFCYLARMQRGGAAVLRALRWTVDAVVTVSGAGQAEGCRCYHGGVGVWRTRLLSRMIVDNHTPYRVGNVGAGALALANRQQE